MNTNTSTSMNSKYARLVAIVLFASTSILLAQETDTTDQSKQVPDVIEIPFSSEDAAKYLSVDMMKGSITIIAHEKADVRVEAVCRYKAHKKNKEGKDGLRVINGRSNSGVYAQVKDNKMEIGAENWKTAVDLTIYVPKEISLDLNAVNDGNISVRGVSGDIEAECINGSVEILEARGSVLAHALNRNLKVELLEVDPNKSMSFSSMNGDIDVTLPADTKADLKLETFNGEILSDFEIELKADAPKPIVEDNKGNKGRYKVSFDKATHATLNGGGELFHFETHNGDILIRKGTPK